MSDETAPEGTEEEASTEEGLDEEFDPDRALRTIRAQRESEKRLKAELAEAREQASAYEAEQAAKADAEKSLEVKVAERDETIKSLRGQISDRAVQQDFERKAADRGIADLGLAWLAAKEEGLLGRHDPKTGTVGDHDFDKLADLYPALAVDEGRFARTGDAGRRGRPKVATPGETFNRSIREAIRR